MVFLVFKSRIDDMNNALISTGEAAKLLSVSRQHVVDLCDRGELAFVRIGSHRRIRTADIARMQNPLTPDEERSLWLHEVVLGHLLMDPQRVLAIARGNIERWKSLHRSDGKSAAYLTEWEEVIGRGIDDVRRILIGTDRLSIELRQNSPFSGVLSRDERAKVLRSFHEHQNELHNSVVA